jgi:pilus assembly protein CpaB
MKKNLVPLLGIAFVVAIATTGIFYGLFVGKLGASNAPASSAGVVVAAKDLPGGTVLTKDDVTLAPWPNIPPPRGSYRSVDAVIGQRLFQPLALGEPVLPARLVDAGGLTIPVGMRAVSTHVVDSSGILTVLKPGHKVDVHVLSRQDNPGIRTLLQNVTVLSLGHAAEPASHNGAPAAPVVTLLVKAEESDALALADSSTRVRLALRNPGDAEVGRGRMLGASWATPGHAPPATPAPETSAPESSSGPASAELSVQVLSLDAAAWRELQAAGERSWNADVFQTARLRSGAKLEETLQSLTAKGQTEVISAARLLLGRHGTAHLEAAQGGTGLKLRFSGLRAGRLQADVHVQTPQGSKSLGTEVEWNPGQIFALTGLVPSQDPAFQGKQLVVLVAPQTR